MGDGIIDLPGIRALIDAAGYDGPIEVEVINPALADRRPATSCSPTSRRASGAPNRGQTPVWAPYKGQPLIELSDLCSSSPRTGRGTRRIAHSLAA